jgi:hypothetical protein
MIHGTVVRVMSGVLLMSSVACSSGDDDDAAAGSGGSQATGSGGAAGSTSAAGSGGQVSTGGSGGATSGSGGATSGSGGATSGSGGATGSGGANGSGGATAMMDAGNPNSLDKFSFFVISYKALFAMAAKMNKPDGFGGDLRYGETGDGAGLRGADKMCTEVAEQSMPGSSAKVWHAFLSTSYENAIDRIGEGPWYDRLGHVFAMKKADLVSERPASADPTIADNLPNEDGVLNHDPDGTGEVDNHDTLTGSNAMGMYYHPDDTSRNCNDWTSTDTSIGRPRVGHTWIRDMMGGPPPGGFPGGGGGPSGDDGSFNHWISSLDEAGCGEGANLIEMGGPDLDDPTVGSGGGYGSFYCFALSP